MPIRTIIAEDSVILRDNIKCLLEDIDLIQIIGEADNGKTALEMTYDLAPDLLFLDIKMPVMTGLEVARHINTFPPYVIFITQYKEFSHEAHEHCPLGYLIKPVQKNELLDSINKIFKFSRGAKCIQDIINDDIRDNIIDEKHCFNRIFIKVGHDKRVLNIENIYSIIAEDGAAVISYRGDSGDELIEVSESVNSLQKRLPSDIFIRSHRASLLNGNFIDSVETVKKNKYEAIIKSRDKKISKAPVSRDEIDRVRWFKSLFSNNIGSWGKQLNEQ